MWLVLVWYGKQKVKEQERGTATVRGKVMGARSFAVLPFLRIEVSKASSLQ